ncbi:MAG TPA: tRNA pseudouridine(55) synthase TruB [Longimicrobiales bacterium]
MRRTVKSMRADRSGVLRVDKPEGPTSHDVVARARRALGIRRIGHTGTLDPFASGLLLLAVGAATRLAEYLTRLPKTYRATARLGVTTDTADRTGAELEVSEAWRELSGERIAEAFRAQTGTIRQRPPAFSAKKVAGERAYTRARRGEEVALEPVPVTIWRLEILAIQPPDVHFEVECSSGTYVRAIARDAGAALGVGAHLTMLRRTRIGPHDVADAVALDRLEDAAAVRRAWLAPADAVAHLPRVAVDAAAATALAHGRTLPAPADAAAGTPIAVVRNHELVAIAERDDGRLRPRKVLGRE